MCGVVLKFNWENEVEGNTFKDEEKAWLGKCNINNCVKGYLLRGIYCIVLLFLGNVKGVPYLLSRVRLYFPWGFVKQSLTNQQLVFVSLETSTNLLGTGKKWFQEEDTTFAYKLVTAKLTGFTSTSGFVS